MQYHSKGFEIFLDLLTFVIGYHHDLFSYRTIKELMKQFNDLLLQVVNLNYTDRNGLEFEELYWG